MQNLSHWRPEFEYRTYIFWGMKEMQRSCGRSWREASSAPFRLKKRVRAARLNPLALCRKCYFLLQSESEPVRRYYIEGWEHRVHRVATAAFWRTFSHEGKICPGWWGWGVHAHPLLLHLPSRVASRPFWKKFGLGKSPALWLALSGWVVVRHRPGPEWGTWGDPQELNWFPAVESHLGVRAPYATRRKRRYEANKCGWTQPLFRK